MPSNPAHGMRTTPIRFVAISRYAFCRGLFDLLAAGFDGRLQGRTVESEEALARLTRDGAVDVVIFVCVDGQESALDQLRRIVGHCGDRPLVVMMPMVTRTLVERSLEAGARGVVGYSQGLEDFLAVLRYVADGGRYVPAEVLSELDRPLPGAAPAEGGLTERLTPRQREVLLLMWEGLSNREIGERLDITEGTVKIHVTRIIERLGARNRVDAARHAHDLALAQADYSGPEHSGP